MENKNEVISYLNTLSVIIFAVALFLFPLFFLTNTSEPFILPKQVLVVGTTVILAILWGVRNVVEKKINLRISPLHLPAAIFGIIILASAIFSLNRFDALMQTIPVVCTIILSFIGVQILSDRKSFNIALSAFTLGAAVSALITILYNFGIYILPFPAIQNQYFSTYGASLQELIYFAPILVLSCFYVFQKKGYLRVHKDMNLILPVITIVVLIAGVAVLIGQMVQAQQKPIILPINYGYQIAFAAISQDSIRPFVAVPLGSGYGTFATDFSRFKLGNFNQEQTIWGLTFAYSSSYFLELIATTGILGALSFLFIVIRFIRTRTRFDTPLFAATVTIMALAFLLPFSFTSVFALFMLLAFYSAFLYLGGSKKVNDVSLSLVAFNNGFISLQDEGEQKRKKDSSFLPIALLVVIVGVFGFVGFYTFRFFQSDATFVASLQEANLNNGQLTYDLQREAIAQFPYRSDYYRVFSQVNLALASSLVNSIPEGSSPSAEVQNTTTTLLQQSINNARAAISISPLTVANWVNLSQIYRNLFNVGENAEQFAIASMQQAIALDPTNPLLRIELGGIYYQLGQYELAQNQFQIAVNLKPDYANGYYNLGHALEAKGDFQGALEAYLVVQQLVQNDENSSKMIQEEINAVEAKAGTEGQAAGDVQPTEGETELELSTPSATFPEQKPKVDLPPPPTGQRTTPTPSEDEEDQEETVSPTPNL